ncbi:hypothetical protein Pth03_81060 [Planotetraspora thailandica]|uniref:Uncharacterized protein n=1 Tax=Planotetraspora thailandica TaxID=487172 RepID=A0A8J4DGL3_9ACTN|nr:hypothetical protein Pth03_81060 [Planotetraspora thailandica]
MPGDGEAEHKSCSGAGGVLHVESAMVSVSDAAGDGQAEDLRPDPNKRR